MASPIPTDDVGSFPLPSEVTREENTRAAALAHRMMVKGANIASLQQNKYLQQKLLGPVVDAFKLKQHAGILWPNYPQFQDMNRQFLDLLGSDLSISPENALIPEVEILQAYAQANFDQTAEKTLCRVCITGPVELGIQLFGANLTADVLLKLATSVNKFVQNYCNDSEYFEVPLLAIDDPSLGIRDLPSLKDADIIAALTEATKATNGREIFIHLHSLTHLKPILRVPNITIIGAEFASTPDYLSFLSEKLLTEYGKKVRAGIAITSFDTLVLRYADSQGMNPGDVYRSPSLLQEVLESVDDIRAHYQPIMEKVGDFVTVAGPDCGLGPWLSQDLAFETLRRVVCAVHSVESD
ncbi:MAG: hypothetical protein ACE5OZ_16685 [Candidatus Heimdallarchaeota archaeon]